LTETPDQQERQNVAKAFGKVLNRHGYAFQYSVIKAIQGVTSQACWSPWTPEFPIEIQGHQGRVDFLLVNRSGDRYLICECKRANPALSHWCFARASFLPDSELSGRSFMETLERERNEIVCGTKILSQSDKIYQVALEVKTTESGDDSTKGRGQIEEAATQVCRGLNGMIEFFYKRELLKQGKDWLAFLPVIFTTAKLWSSEVDLSSADLQRGEIDTSSLIVESRSWLWFQFHQSPGLKHPIRRRKVSYDMREILFNEFVRPVAIVTPAGIAEFLSSNIWSY